MVTSKEGDVFWIFDLITEQQFDSLDWIIPSINEITNEDVPSLW